MTTTTRGEPPLKKLQKKFMSFATEVEKDADNLNDCERLYKAFLQEINNFELPIQRQILQAQTDIEDLKNQLEKSKIKRHHKEE
jgi:THO complex subunit 7